MNYSFGNWDTDLVKLDFSQLTMKVIQWNVSIFNAGNQFKFSKKQATYSIQDHTCWIKQYALVDIFSLVSYFCAYTDITSRMYTTISLCLIHLLKYLFSCPPLSWTNFHPLEGSINFTDNLCSKGVNVANKLWHNAFDHLNFLFHFF